MRDTLGFWEEKNRKGWEEGEGKGKERAEKHRSLVHSKFNRARCL